LKSNFVVVGTRASGAEFCLKEFTGPAVIEPQHSGHSARIATRQNEPVERDLSAFLRSSKYERAILSRLIKAKRVEQTSSGNRQLTVAAAPKFRQIDDGRNWALRKVPDCAGRYTRTPMTLPER
jgi:hypothetical protein